MDVSIRSKVTLFTRLFLRGIFGNENEVEKVLPEVLDDKYTHEQMEKVVTKFDKDFTNDALAALSANGKVCDALNCLPGTAEDKHQLIVSRIWGELSVLAKQYP